MNEFILYFSQLALSLPLFKTAFEFTKGKTNTLYK